MRPKPDTNRPTREREQQPAEYDLPKDRKRLGGERRGETADSVRPYMDHERKLVHPGR